MTLRLGRHSFADDRRLMMAIVNRTPDSFYDKGATWAEDKAFDRVAEVVEQGAEIIDIGGIKAGPGDEIDVAEELRRTVGFVERVRAAHPDVVISVDTWRAPVGRAVCEVGADLLNDAWGGADPELVDVAAEYDAGWSAPTRGEWPRGPARTGSSTPTCGQRGRRHHGVRRTGPGRRGGPGGIVIDPAHDFGKTTRDSLDLTRRLDELVATGWPVLVSLSNKDFVGEALDLPVGSGSPAPSRRRPIAALHGARIFRVHEVRETRQVVDMVDVISGAGVRRGRSGDLRDRDHRWSCRARLHCFTRSRRPTPCRSCAPPAAAVGKSAPWRAGHRGGRTHERGEPGRGVAEPLGHRVARHLLGETPFVAELALPWGAPR